MTVLAQELRCALELIERCGAIALRIQSGGDETLQTTDKADDQGPVTQADLAVEQAIVETLRAQFPGDAILAEEKARDDAWRRAERVWMIDPVDGTRDFAGGDPSWAIHIGLCVGGRPALGVVAQPGSRRVSWGIDLGPGPGDHREAWTRVGDGAPQALTGPEAQRDPLEWQLVTSKSHRSPRLDPLAERLAIPRDQQLRCGSCGVKTTMVARGQARIYAHPSIGTKLWDSCAPQVILHATGGTLTSLTGRAIDYAGPDIGNDHGLLATGPGQDHAAIVAALAPLAAEWFPA